MKLNDLWCSGDQSNHPFQMIYQGKPCLPYFSSVVKNVASPSIEIKKLVYIYLLHYAESDPDLALLSVNAIQKSLTDQNPQVRAMALRTMSGLRVPVISQIVSLAIKRGVGDMSPHVRKAAALSIPKCYRLDPNTLPQLLEYLSTLMGDRQYSHGNPFHGEPRESYEPRRPDSTTMSKTTLPWRMRPKKFKFSIPTWNSS
jgi:hypothetical protein